MKKLSRYKIEVFSTNFPNIVENKIEAHITHIKNIINNKPYNLSLACIQILDFSLFIRSQKELFTALVKYVMSLVPEKNNIASVKTPLTTPVISTLLFKNWVNISPVNQGRDFPASVTTSFTISELQ